MNTSWAVVTVAIATMLAGCASVISGTSQTLTLDTIPSGADCSLSKKGLVIGRVNPTPGAVFVQRTRDDITVECRKDGYQVGSFVNRSGLEAATIGNVILGGLVGVVVDAASGANNKYDEKMRITLAATDETLRATSPPEGALPAAIEFHCPVAGTVIRNSSGGQLTFTEQNGLRCGYTDEAGQKRERYALFADGYGLIARKEMDALWPLKVGKTVSFQVRETMPVNYAGSTPDRQEDFVVNRQERIAVPAGTFDTLVVEWTEQEKAANPTGALVTLWYAPGVGYVVKSSVHMLNANEVKPYSASRYAGMTFDATEITMPNGAPLPVAVSTPQPVAAPSATIPAAAPESGSPADRLKALNDLRDQKLITPAEYETRRKAILNGL